MIDRGIPVGIISHVVQMVIGKEPLHPPIFADGLYACGQYIPHEVGPVKAVGQRSPSWMTHSGDHGKLRPCLRADGYSVGTLLCALHGEVPDNIYNTEVVPRWQSRFAGPLTAQRLSAAAVEASIEKRLGPWSMARSSSTVTAANRSRWGWRR